MFGRGSRRGGDGCRGADSRRRRRGGLRKQFRSFRLHLDHEFLRIWRHFRADMAACGAIGPSGCYGGRYATKNLERTSRSERRSITRPCRGVTGLF
jgi:hypothetical protein